METMIELNGIQKTLSGKPVLQGLDLKVHQGETLVIVGGSGMGKSVTLKHMVGLMTPDEGYVTVKGQDLLQASRQQLAEIRQNFGMLFQSGALLAWMTVRENVALPLYEHSNLTEKEIYERVDEKLEMVGLQGAQHKRPAEISGGMKKRAALARAIIHAPDIILYDEPTSGLDPVMSRRIDQLILDMQAKLKITSVVVTHDLVSAFNVGDRVAMLSGGVVTEVSPPKVFRASTSPDVQEFVKAQFQEGHTHGS